MACEAARTTAIAQNMVFKVRYLLATGIEDDRYEARNRGFLKKAAKTLARL
jgi:hypothetical protein